MFKILNRKKLISILFLFIFIFTFSNNVYATIFNGNPEIVDKLNSAFEKIKNWMLKLATPSAAVAIAVGIFMKKHNLEFKKKAYHYIVLRKAVHFWKVLYHSGNRLKSERR